MKADKIKLYTAIRDYGQMINKITFQMDPVVPGLTPDDFETIDCFDDLSAKRSISGIKTVEINGSEVTLTMDWFLYRIDFQIKGKGLKFPGEKRTGDLLVRIVVKTPTKLSSEQEKLLREFERLSEEEGKSGLFDKVKKAMGME